MVAGRKEIRSSRRTTQDQAAGDRLQIEAAANLGLGGEGSSAVREKGFFAAEVWGVFMATEREEKILQ
ncbi:hypothetical protein Ancab_017153, partial [Ancistrocladus abbreviatus]